MSLILDGKRAPPCEAPGCTRPALCGVGGKLVCQEHLDGVLDNVAASMGRAGIAMTIDRKGGTS